MSQSLQTVVGIDVGGERKGFHAVALRDGKFVEKVKTTDPAIVVAWCLEQKAAVVAVDAPCGWSRNGSSRQAEREIQLFGQQIFCFSTPTRQRAVNHATGFYNWVLNGEKLYSLLARHYPLFTGERRSGPSCIETFPQAVACVLAGRIISAKHKKTVRRAALKDRVYNTDILTNIDFVDAALCAVAADAFSKNSYQSFGNRDEGFIVVPKHSGT